MKSSKYEFLNPKQITNNKSEIRNDWNLIFDISVLFSVSGLEFSAYELEGARR